MKTITIKLPEVAYLGLVTFLRSYLENVDEIPVASRTPEEVILKHLLTVPATSLNKVLDYSKREDITISIN